MRVVTVVVACLLVVSVVDAGRKGAPSMDRDMRLPSSPTMMNKVVDLLDGEVDVGEDSDPQTWESEVFDTSQFTIIGIRIAGEAETGSVVCGVAWQFGFDDPFEDSYPVDILVSEWELPEQQEPIQRPDGIPDIYFPNPRTYYYGGYLSDFGAVRGMRAKVVCEAVSRWLDWGIVNDPTDPPEPPPAPSGVLTDVKVLLRRD